MNRLLSTSAAWVLLTVAALFVTGCGSLGRGTTQEFEAHAPSTIFVLAPRSELVSGAQAEAIRGAVMRELRRKGYGVSSAADATLIPDVERWGTRASWGGPDQAQVSLGARLLDRADRLLWEDEGTALEELDEDGDADSVLEAAVESLAADWKTERPGLIAEAVRELLRSLPDAAPR